MSIDSFLDPIENSELKIESQNSLDKNGQNNVSIVDLTQTLPSRNKKKVNVSRSFSYSIGRLTETANAHVGEVSLSPEIIHSNKEINAAIESSTESPNKESSKNFSNSKNTIKSSIKSSLTSINDITGKAKSYAETNNFKLTNTNSNNVNSLNGHSNTIQGSLSQNFLGINQYNSKSSDKIYSIAGTINSATANSTSAVNTLNKINQNESIFGKYDFSLIFLGFFDD